MKQTCPYCNYLRCTKVLVVNKIYSLFACPRCFLTFTFPQPKTLEKNNNEKYDSIEEKESRLAAYKDEYSMAKKHIESLMVYKKSGKYLDVGCSYGICVKAAQDKGFSAYGIEPTLRAATYAKKTLHLKVQHASLEKAKLQKESFDVVTLYDVLEHIPNLSAFLTEVQRILKPKGLLVIKSPNCESYAFRLLGKNWNWLLIPQHVWHFSKRSLSMIVEEHNFRVLHTTTEDGVYDFASNLTSKLFAYKTPKNFFEKVIQKSVYLVLYAGIFLGTSLWSSFGKGGTIYIYATKNYK